ncbi:mitochondrial distribution and morphology protein 10 [Drechslerella stenobrocha 248]|uniref:Mitochondrial distribution and morphology protein 10 n=1 Tax=Drechslerella stenobrocha 248 TaxID=1043628 RepID=W7I904_9PEZI|nr:mitochondrial distribution and morphology protein 10 [Drechslerella stenobrocha 248]
MLGFMEYVQKCFYTATKWDEDNSYASLNATARALLDFPTPKGLKMNLSSLSSPNFATSYSMASLGVVDGSLSYLYSSRPLTNALNSGDVQLSDAASGYRNLKTIMKPDDKRDWEIWQGGLRVDRRDTLLYGRMYLPASTLEALYLRRLAPTRQLKILAVSNSRLPNGGTILAQMQQDNGKWSTEYLYSTDVALIGMRGLYNFGFDPRKAAAATSSKTAALDPRMMAGRFSAGAEVYYGILNKSGGVSTGFRYTALPSNVGSPLTFTMTVNPLMGHFQASYAVKAGEGAVFCSRYDFNIYSYESDLVLGCELWRWRQAAAANDSTAAANIGGTWQPETALVPTSEKREDNVTGIIKARITQNFNIGLLWEGRFKHLLFSIGSNIDLKRREQPFRTVGIEIQYNS